MRETIEEWDPQMSDTGETAQGLRRVYFVFLWHGGFLALTMAMIEFNTVFPALVTKLTASKVAFGFLYSIMLGAPLIFNLLFSHWMRRHAFKKKFLLVGIYIRALSFLGMASFVFLFGVERPLLVVASFAFWIFLFSISGGFAGIAYLDIIGKVVPESARSTFFASKQFVSSITALSGGLLIRKLLDPRAFAFPLNYTIILTIAFLGLVLAAFGFWAIREPASEVEDDQETFSQFVAKIPSILHRDPHFMRFIIVENSASFSLMILPFYMVFAREVLGVGNEFVSRYLIFLIVGTIASNLVWGQIGQRWTSKAVVRVCVLLGSIVPLVALGLAQLGPSPFALVFFLIGFLQTGRRIGFDPYLLSLAPNTMRTTYIGVKGTLSIMIAISPLLGGVLIEAIGFPIVFIGVSLVMLFSFSLLR